MRRAGMLLLEVIVALALLASLGVAIVRIQMQATHQYRVAQRLDTAVARTRDLLWQWSDNGVAVTIPASGAISETMSWRRVVRPTRVTFGVLATEITVRVFHTAPEQDPIEIYQVAWLLPDTRS